MMHDLLYIKQGKCVSDQEVVLSDLQLRICEGEISAVLCGRAREREILSDLLNGHAALESGFLCYRGAWQSASKPMRLPEMDTAMIGAQSKLIDSLTLAENLLLTHLQRRPILHYNRLFEQADRLFQRFSLPLSARGHVLDLAGFQRVQAELLKAYSEGRKLIVVDNLGGFVPENEQESILELIEKMRGEGLTFVLLDNYEPRLLDYAENITVITNGRTQFFFNRGELQADAVYSLLTDGRKRSAFGTQAQGGPAPFFVLEGLTGKTLQNASLSISAGETILLVYDHMRAAEELFAALQGEKVLSAGKMWISEREYRPADVLEANENGVCFISNMPVREQLFPRMSLFDNLCIPKSRWRDWPIWLLRRYRRNVLRLCQKYLKTDRDLQTLSDLPPEDLIRVLYLKWMIRRPPLLVCFHPFSTDVQSRLAAEEMIRVMGKRGISVLLISPSSTTIRPFEGRTLLLRDGKIVQCPESAGEKQLLD